MRHMLEGVATLAVVGIAEDVSELRRAGEQYGGTILRDSRTAEFEIELRARAG